MVMEGLSLASGGGGGGAAVGVRGEIGVVTGRVGGIAVVCG